MPETPEPNSQKAIRELLSRLLHLAADGELLSISVVVELASGTMSCVGTEPTSHYALSGFLHQLANVISEEKFYEDEIYDGIDLDEGEHDEDDEEIGDPS